MKIMKKIKFYLYLIVVAFFVFSGVGFFINKDVDTITTVLAGAGDNVSGYAWSDNIGWISFNNLNGSSTIDYGVKIDDNKTSSTYGDFSGYAWSDNLGWVSFNRSDTGNPPEAPFNTGSGPIARIDWSSGNVTGWARVLSGSYLGSSPVAISTCTELQNIKNDVTASYYLTNDIDCSATSGWNSTFFGGPKGFEPIVGFSGAFDGYGFNISGLFINRSRDDMVGLFGTVDRGKIKNVNLISPSIEGDQDVGSLAGVVIGGFIQNVSAQGVSVISNRDNVGGLVGVIRSGSVIENSYSTGGVNVINNQVDSVGGLVGEVRDSQILYSYSTAQVSGQRSVGGLVGLSTKSSIKFSYAIGDIATSRFPQRRFGGLVGELREGVIEQSYSTGNVMATGVDDVGGLVGWVAGSLKASIIKNVYSTGDVTGYTTVGGLIGNAQDSSLVINGYSTGSVSGNNRVGGLIGSIDTNTVVSSYWDITTSNQTTSAGGVGKTTTEMKQQSIFTGWDFSNTWNINEGVSYPNLSNINTYVNYDWDGWIKLSGIAADGSSYGVTLDIISGSPTENKFSGYAWGSDVVGWIDFGASTLFDGSACGTCGVVFGILNTPPSDPAITPLSPSTGLKLVNNTFIVKSDDPGDDVRYGFDWDSNGTIDQWLPSVGYISAGVDVSVAHLWSSTGAKIFKVITEDDGGLRSGWVNYNITISETECSNGKDDDGDGWFDYNANINLRDPGCSSFVDNNESNNPQCSDGIDNDGDGYCDSLDSKCTDGSLLGDLSCSDKFGAKEDGPICNNDGVCGVGESVLSCPKDCFSIREF